MVVSEMENLRDVVKKEPQLHFKVFSDTAGIFSEISHFYSSESVVTKL